MEDPHSNFKKSFFLFLMSILSVSFVLPNASLVSFVPLVLAFLSSSYRSQGQRNRFSGSTSQRLKKDIDIKTTPSGWWYAPTIYSPWFVTREFGEVRWDRWVCSKWNDPLFSCLNFCCPQTNKESEKTYA